MGITLGDVTSVLAFVAAIGFSIWSSTLLSALLFHEKAKRAQRLLQSAPGRTMASGLVWGFITIGLSVAFASQPLPIAKLIGFAGIGLTLLLASIGWAGLAFAAQERITTLDNQFSPLVGLVKCATWITLAAITPVLGWMLVGPVLLVAGIGAGWNSIFSGRAPAPASTEV